MSSLIKILTGYNLKIRHHNGKSNENLSVSKYSPNRKK